jgi:hypothetical protein
METYIRYKRFHKEINEEDIQAFLDELVKDGWEIISYNESIREISKKIILFIVVLAGKKQDNALPKVL